MKASCTSEDTRAYPIGASKSAEGHQGDDAEDTSGSEESDASQVESIRGLSDDDKVVILTVFEE